MRSKWFSVRRRHSHVAGAWGLLWLHANEYGGAVLRGKSGLRTWHGIMLKTPRHFVTFVFRRRELRI